MRELPAKDDSQDAITYNWHVFADILGNQPKRQTLCEAYRVLREGGVIVLDLPDREFGDIQKDGIYIHNPGGERVFIGYVPTEEEMKQFLTEAGFEKIQVKKWETKKGFHKVTFMGEKTE